MPEAEPTTKPYGYIYLVTNTHNQKIYVGQTTRPIADRWREDCRD